jgi:hypothetical protein
MTRQKVILIDPKGGAMRTWYVTFEVSKRGTSKRRRHPRLTQTFETEVEAKRFARDKLDEGLIVFAGTINPYRPKQLIPSTDLSSWIESAQQHTECSQP